MYIDTDWGDGAAGGEGALPPVSPQEPCPSMRGSLCRSRRYCWSYAPSAGASEINKNSDARSMEV